MRNIVYILGAGFSVPAGLPTIKDFLPAAYELHGEHPSEFEYFDKVFKQIDALGHINTYYKTDLNNIEEVLSIIEMRAFTNNKDEQELRDIEKFICAVIKAKTPILKPQDYSSFRTYLERKQYSGFIFPYLSFVQGLHRIRLQSMSNALVRIAGGSYQQIAAERYESKNSYSVITLNYDVLLEQSWDYLCENIPGAKAASKWMNIDSKENGVVFAKLHGDAISENIISPTWNKSKVTTPNKDVIRTAWINAEHLLERATDIRIIGYSLPISDSYVRYLLKAAIRDSRTLRQIDVISLGGQELKNHYKELITTRDFRFANANVTDFIQGCYPNHINGSWQVDIETAHRNVMNKSLN